MINSNIIIIISLFCTLGIQLFVNWNIWAITTYTPKTPINPILSLIQGIGNNLHLLELPRYSERAYGGINFNKNPKYIKTANFPHTNFIASPILWKSKQLQFLQLYKQCLNIHTNVSNRHIKLFSSTSNNFEEWNNTSSFNSTQFGSQWNSSLLKDSDYFFGISQVAKRYGLSMNPPSPQKPTKDEKSFQKQHHNASNFLFSVEDYKSQDPFHENNNPFLPSNIYLNAVIKQSPNELIMNFVHSAPRRVQEAVKITVMGLLGTLPKFALETTILTTGEKLANLMYQLLVTGYMFKNAEYRMSLSESLNVPSEDIFSYANPNKDVGTPPSSTDSRYETNNTHLYNKGLPSIEISGDISFKSPDGKITKTNASLLIFELRKRIIALQEQIELNNKNSNSDDLLSFIKALPEAHIRSLTENISDEVIEAMRRLTNIVVEGLGANKDLGNESITQQTGTIIAQLCMWQLAVGYNFRDLEVREDMRKSFEN